MRFPVLLIALAFVGLPLAGCFGNDGPPPSYTVKATGGKASAGWAYDGANVTTAEATLDGTVVNAENAGALYANFSYHGGKYAVVFDQFKEAQGKTFQDGGVAFGLTEHGDSGTADAAIPKIHAKVAAYGFATVTRDGTPVTGKAGNLWSAHLMVYDDAVRGADGKITKADGTTPYDPSTPADAKTYPGQAQAMLKLVSPDGETAQRAPVHVDKNVTIQGPNAAAPDVDIPVEQGAEGFKISVNSTTAAPAGAPPQTPPIGAAQITITIKIGNKTIADGPATVTPAAPYTKTFDVKAEDLAGLTGPVKVSVSGSGVANVQITADVAYDDHPFIVLTWDNPTLS